MILLDTNLLVRMTDSTDPQCADSRRAINVLLSQREQLIIVPIAVLSCLLALLTRAVHRGWQDRQQARRDVRIGWHGGRPVDDQRADA